MIHHLLSYTEWGIFLGRLSAFAEDHGLARHKYGGLARG